MRRTDRQGETKRTRKRSNTSQRRRERHGQTDGLTPSQPPTRALPRPAPTLPSLARWGGRGSERHLTRLAAQRCPTPCPTLPGPEVPSSPESSHGSARAGDTWAWGPGVGSGLRPWQAPIFGPALPSSGHPTPAGPGSGETGSRGISSLLSAPELPPPSLPCLHGPGPGWGLGRAGPGS